MQNAKERQYEREIVLERKIAREQAEEDSNLEFKGKDKFVTKSYKRKLEEREEWAKQEQERVKRDQKDDVRKKVGGSAMMGFYGNLSRIGGGAGARASASVAGAGADSVAQSGSGGAGGKDQAENMNSNGIEKDQSATRHGRYDRADAQTEPSSSKYSRRNERTDGHEKEHTNTGTIQEVEIEQVMAQQKKRIERMQKIFKARDRYLERKALKNEAEAEPQ